MAASFTHLDEEGRVRMVDITSKEPTVREARAEGAIRMSPELLDMVVCGKVPKGNVFETARIAGIMAAKKTADLIPLCHPLQLTAVSLDFTVDRKLPGVHITAIVRTTDRTGVEMEALTAVSVAALTVYDMCKALDKTMTIDQIRLVYKSGGKSGVFVRDGNLVLNSDEGETNLQR
ncbi:cyclic pyranopterin monophosphate synthase MoaC [Thermodesulforhabdus norvegica]|uniref:Cyclic pyranopterin monophosphate synthase n=1 Tax=Thermodesulforhabdus norvegica TaxID=39841 RepID=A0A1I4RB14_9BACT|nr:cyclic pyranopterin monophosphate synthase MoaC [Thermodesulforhabdus norvegica]SFM49395.1 cyclic pyranopterin monophosphate synthase subunit MoaC [Thermodesulforhabdus norvegica]